MYNLLIVEDDASIREAFTIILELNGTYEVASAENGKVALELCKKNTYDLILLDIMMPVMDGPSFLKEYSTLYPSDVTKIIIMSNLSSGSELSIVQDYGVDRAVLKSSLTPQKLMDIVAEVLRQRTEIQHELHNADDNSDSVNESDEKPIGETY